MKPIVCLAVVSLCFFWASPLRVASAENSTSALAIAGDVGFGSIGDFAYSTLQAGVDLREGNLAMGAFGRIRLGMYDSAGQSPVRSQDWDEVGDYVHVLRYLKYRRFFGRLNLEIRAGELLGQTLGHGTLIRDYSNVSDLNHLHAGMLIQADHPRFTVTAMLDNLVQPSVIAGRVSANPFSKIPDLAFGASLSIDPRAPIRVLQDADGVRLINRGFNLITEDTVLGLAGLDAQYLIGNRQKGNLTPYMDFNTSFYGIGLHAGALAQAALGKARLNGQVEYRVTTSGYAPTYVHTFYDMHRYQTSFVNSGYQDPKLAGLLRGEYGGQGVLAQLGANTGQLAQVKLGYSYQPGPNSHQLWFSATTNPITRLHMGLLLVWQGLGEGEELDGFAAMGEARFRILPNLYALAQYTRTWALQEDSRYYGILQSFNIGVGANWAD
ncbi:MAG: hypothetical protein V1754_06420 [Pseudomonadota bacterium]